MLQWTNCLYKSSPRWKSHASEIAGCMITSWYIFTYTREFVTLAYPWVQTTANKLKRIQTKRPNGSSARSKGTEHSAQTKWPEWKVAHIQRCLSFIRLFSIQNNPALTQFIEIRINFNEILLFFWNLICIPRLSRIKPYRHEITGW